MSRFPEAGRKAVLPGNAVMAQHHVVPLQFVPTNGSVLLLPVKKAIELKSRGVKMLPNKDGSHKISVCKSSAFYTGIGVSGRVQHRGHFSLQQCQGVTLQSAFPASSPTCVPPAVFSGRKNCGGRGSC